MNLWRAVLASCYLSSLAAAAVDPAALHEAVGLYDQHHPREAEQAFAALAAQDSANAEVQFYLGRLALQRDDPEEAVPALERAVALAPDNSVYHQGLGDAYGLSAAKASVFAQLALARKCRAEYEQAIKLDPKNVDARWGLMEFCRRAPGLVGGGLDKALTQAQEIKKLDSTRGRIALASLYAADRQYGLAFAEFSEVLNSEPDSYDANYQFGRMVAQSGQRLAAGLAALRKCLRQQAPNGLPNHAAVYWRIGNILELRNDRAGARAAYETALRLDPKFIQASEALKKLH